MKILHKVYLTLIALVGVPIALLGVLLAIPASLDLSPAAFILLLPAILVVWSILLLTRGRKMAKPRLQLIVFYGVSAIISVWSTTWTFSRDGNSGFIFNPVIGVPVSLFFIVPIVELLYSGQKTVNTEQESGPAVR